ncbi:hypothetical protein VTN00DRAFT_7092 [Thermoascus crustaceus]|uniref:uncharacterized protein n=1 Tax=Thermoascus crustaceus TaxID=5088 RepID=UPI003742320B
MDLLACWSNKRLDTFQFRLRIECQPLDETCSPTTEEYPIQLQRIGDNLRWTVDGRELEAVLGLWTWSLLKSDKSFRPGQPLSRLIGQDPKDAMTEEADLYYHKWIFRQTEAKMVSAKMIPASHELFGCHLDKLSSDMEILVVKTQNPLCAMAAQDLYIHFLNSALETLEELGGEVDILPSSLNTFVAHSSRIEQLVQCFENNSLGSKEDALLCIVPTLKRKGLLPELSAHLSTIRQRVERYIENLEWKEALSMLAWLCERSEREEFEHSVVEFGYLCHRAMLHPNSDARREGTVQVLGALNQDLRLQYFKNISKPRPPGWMNSPLRSEWWGRFTKELGWLAWNITEDEHDKRSMESYGANAYSLSTGVVDGSSDLAERGRLAVLQWLAKSDDTTFDRDVPGEDDRLALDWVSQNNYEFLLRWLMIRWATVGAKYPDFLYIILVWAAKRHYRSAIGALRRRGVNLNVMESEEGKTPLIQSVVEADHEAVRTLLENGADIDGKTENGVTPLMTAAHEGRLEIVQLLLQLGATVCLQDDQGLTALMWAAHGNHTDIAKLLLENGANVNIGSSNGSTALILAASENHVEMLKLLLAWGAYIDAQMTDGSTSLMLAARNKCEAVVRLLLNHNADVHKTCAAGGTALDRARETQHPESIQLLEAASGV